MKNSYSPERLERLIRAVVELREDAYRLEQQFKSEIARIPVEHQPSARNLVHYLAVRNKDIRPLQEDLHEIGLSSLGRLEPYVVASLRAVERALAALLGQEPEEGEADDTVGFAHGRDLLEHHATELFGESNRRVRIMVTMPDKAGDDPELIPALLDAGMDVMRVNCSKGESPEWLRLVDQLRDAVKHSSRNCCILFDLEGPNPRTGDLPKKIRLSPGDEIELVAEKSASAVEGNEGVRRVPISMEAVFDAAEVGHAVVFDDGKLEGEVVSKSDGQMRVRILNARKGRTKLGGGKGINFPDTPLEVPSLTEKDLGSLDVVTEIADLVGFSFVRAPEDIDTLQRELKRRNGDHLGTLLKIETREAFENLPKLLLTAMAKPPIGVMIARGDMAAELGFERMAEVQEEILWLCEAAHTPVIWATQVLESLAKKGVPTRGDMTDAALGVRAECVMLNKGKNIVETVALLARLLSRMSAHRKKKWSLLRKLSVASVE